MAAIVVDEDEHVAFGKALVLNQILFDIRHVIVAA
jgi:hypothetical protein